MKHDEFIGQVRARAQLDGRGPAETATRATLETLETLAERVPDSVANNLAGQLPTGIAEPLKRGTGENSNVAERFGKDEFVARVAQRGYLSETEADRQARVVLQLVDEATHDVMAEVRESLPADLQELLQPPGLSST
jgi:uncharacterized protein (DUF2267 family)